MENGKKIWIFTVLGVGLEDPGNVCDGSDDVKDRLLVDRSCRLRFFFFFDRWDFYFLFLF